MDSEFCLTDLGESVWFHEDFQQVLNTYWNNADSGTGKRIIKILIKDKCSFTNSHESPQSYFTGSLQDYTPQSLSPNFDLFVN